jgi:hypothetical protein
LALYIIKKDEITLPYPSLHAVKLPALVRPVFDRGEKKCGAAMATAPPPQVYLLMVKFISENEFNFA